MAEIETTTIQSNIELHTQIYTSPLPNILINHLVDKGIDRNELEAVEAYPTPINPELPRGQYNAIEILAPFLENPQTAAIIQKTIPEMDLTVGCVQVCHTCYADIPPYRARFETGSALALISNPETNSILQPNFRIGSYADPIDHPSVVDFVNKVFEAGTDTERRKLTMFSSYRPYRKEAYLQLAQLANSLSGERFKLGISIPYNYDETIKEQLLADANEHQILRRYIGNDVRRLAKDQFIHLLGRVIDVDDEIQKDTHFNNHDQSSYPDTGCVDLYLNPHGLWFRIQTNSEDSHTRALFVPLNPDRLILLSQSPFNPGSGNPSNWPSGQYNISKHEYNSLNPKPLSVAKRIKK